MGNFRTKLFGFVGAAMTFAGMAYGQAVCANPVGTAANVIRAEGTTELVASTVFTCTSGAGGAAAGAVSIQAFLTLPVTSKVLSTTPPTAGFTEAVVLVSAAGGGAGGAPVNGVIGANGSTINFSTVPVPALVGATFYTITVQNVRVNASTLTIGSGAPPPVTESFLVQGPVPVVNTFASSPATTVALVEAGISSKENAGAFLGGVSPFPGGVKFVTCTGYGPTPPIGGASGLSTIVTVTSGFQTSFKTLAGEAPQSAQVIGAITNAATQGTRVQLAFANVPANVTLYVPITVTDATATLTLTASATGPLSAVAATTPTLFNGLFGFAPAAPLAAPANSAGMAPVTISGGAGTAVYEITADTNTAIDTFLIGVYVFSAANAVVPSPNAITTAVSFAPVGSTTNIPNFVAGPSTTSLVGSTYSICQTSLLFPFITNQLGFDTGLVLANTSTDPFGGAIFGGATAQTGTCNLNFYGAGAPTNPVAAPGGAQATATTNAFLLSSVAPGFQGYMIAQCNYQFGHGFAYIAYDLTQNNGAVIGYLAEVFTAGAARTLVANVETVTF